jgi:type IV pilus assembly protein PilC
MFLILLLISALGLWSIITTMLLAACYGVGLILLVGKIRNARLEVSRGQLGGILLALCVDQFLSAAIALTLATMIVGFPLTHELFPLVHGPKVQHEAWIISTAAILGFFGTIWLATGVLLMFVWESLTERGSVQGELDWEPWLTVMIVGGCLLQIPTLFSFLLICTPFLLQIRRLTRINRQGNLIWTLSLAVHRGLPFGPEIKNLSEGLWGRERMRLLLLSENLDSGQSLSNSLERQPGLVPLWLVTQLRLGEETGTVNEVLTSCAIRQVQHYAREEDVVATQNAFMILLLPIMFLPLIVGFIGYYIVPKQKKILEDFGMEIPEITKFVFKLLGHDLGFSTFLGFVAMACAMTTVIIFVRERERDWPFLRWLSPRSNTPLILRALALLIAESRPLSTGLCALAGSHPRSSVRTQLKRVLSKIDHGANAWEALAAERLIGAHDLLLLRAAERVHNLPWALEQISEMIERRTWNRLRVVMEIAFPIVAVCIGLIVLLFTTAFTMPMISIIKALA